MKGLCQANVAFKLCGLRLTDFAALSVLTFGGQIAPPFCTESNSMLATIAKRNPSVISDEEQMCHCACDCGAIASITMRVFLRFQDLSCSCTDCYNVHIELLCNVDACLGSSHVIVRLMSTRQT